MGQKEELVYMAKLAEQTERYEEMVEYMTQVAILSKEVENGMTLEERNLLSVAYKNVIGARRAAWRVIRSVEDKQKEQQQGQQQYSPDLLKKYREEIEKELRKTCREILDTLDTHLIPNEKAGEAKVFFYKMQGDYHRYIAEIELPHEGSTSDKVCEDAEKSEKAYMKAQEIAKEELAPTHPIRLGLALNFSVYYYEIKGNAEKACKSAKEAFDDAIAELDSLSEDSYKDSTLIMQLLRDNLTLWSTEDKSDTVVQDIEQED